MGVMKCDRYNCEHVCCEYLFNGRTYICDECIKEFLRVLEDANIMTCTEKYFDKILYKFLKTNKGEFYLKYKKSPKPIIDVKEYVSKCSRYYD